SAGVALWIFSILDWFQVGTPAIKISLSILSGFASSIILSLYNRLHLLNKYSFTRYLNVKFPSLKESADLLLFDDDDLTGLQQLQRIKTIEQFNLIYPSVKLPHHLVRSSIILLMSFSVYFIASSFSNSRKEKFNKSLPSKILQSLNKGVQSASIRSLSITIN